MSAAPESGFAGYNKSCEGVNKTTTKMPAGGVGRGVRWVRGREGLGGVMRAGGGGVVHGGVEWGGGGWVVGNKRA